MNHSVGFSSGAGKKSPARSGDEIQNARGGDFVRRYRMSNFRCTHGRTREHGAQLFPIPHSRRKRAEDPWCISARFSEKASEDGALFRKEKEGANRREAEAVYK